MRNFKYMSLLFIFISFSLLNADQNVPVEPEIQQFVATFVKKWNEHNPKELIELWAENGDLINPAGEWEKGKSNVINILLREHQGILNKSKMEQEITNVIMLNPTTAWVDAKVSLNIPGLPKELDHHVVYLLTKQNNQWRILAARPYQFLELHLGLLESPHAMK